MHPYHIIQLEVRWEIGIIIQPTPFFVVKVQFVLLSDIFVVQPHGRRNRGGYIRPDKNIIIWARLLDLEQAET